MAPVKFNPLKAYRQGKTDDYYENYDKIEWNNKKKKIRIKKNQEEEEES